MPLFNSERAAALQRGALPRVAMGPDATVGLIAMTAGANGMECEMTELGALQRSHTGFSRGHTLNTSLEVDFSHDAEWIATAVIDPVETPDSGEFTNITWRAAMGGRGHGMGESSLEAGDIAKGAGKGSGHRALGDARPGHISMYCSDTAFIGNFMEAGPEQRSHDAIVRGPNHGIALTLNFSADAGWSASALVTPAETRTRGIETEVRWRAGMGAAGSGIGFNTLTAMHMGKGMGKGYNNLCVSAPSNVVDEDAMAVETEAAMQAARHASASGPVSFTPP